MTSFGKNGTCQGMEALEFNSRQKTNELKEKENKAVDRHQCKAPAYITQKGRGEKGKLKRATSERKMEGDEWGIERYAIGPPPK